MLQALLIFPNNNVTHSVLLLSIEQWIIIELYVKWILSYHIHNIYVYIHIMQLSHVSKKFILTKPPLYLKSFHPELDNLQLMNFKSTLSIYAFFYVSDKQEPFYLLPLLIFSIMLAYLHIMGKCCLPTQQSAKSV